LGVRFDEFHGADTRDPAIFNPEFLYNGTPYVSQAMRYEKTKHTANLRYAQVIGELNVLLDCLVQSCDIPASASKLDPAAFLALGPRVRIPDFILNLTNGDECFVEVTTAGTTSTIRLENTISDMSSALAQWSTTHDSAVAALAGRSLSFVLQAPIGGRNEKAAVEEMKRFILTERLDAYAGSCLHEVPDWYPILNSAETDVMYHETPSSYAYAHVKTPASYYSPIDECQSVLSAIDEKIQNGYAHFRPIFLVVGMDKVIEPWRYTFDAVKGALRDLGPFSRVYIANSNHA